MGKIIKNKVKVISFGRENIYKITDNEVFIKTIKEIYISEIKPKSQKTWKYSEDTQQNIYVFNSKIELSTTKDLKKKNKIISLDKKFSYLIRIPKKTFYTFKNIGRKKGFILNMIDNKYKTK
jgi:hypothetical protein